MLVTFGFCNASRSSRLRKKLYSRAQEPISWISHLSVYRWMDYKRRLSKTFIVKFRRDDQEQVLLFINITRIRLEWKEAKFLSSIKGQHNSVMHIVYDFRNP